VRAALGVGAGAWVVAEAAKNDNIERIVGSTVTAAIEPASVGASAAGGDTRLPMSILDDVDEIGACTAILTSCDSSATEYLPLNRSQP
jgi:hypothetical protein